jgi:hypothetical protein
VELKIAMKTILTGAVVAMVIGGVGSVYQHIRFRS